MALCWLCTSLLEEWDVLSSVLLSVQVLHTHHTHRMFASMCISLPKSVPSHLHFHFRTFPCNMDSLVWAVV
jgi:hypothetical protein